MTRNMRITLVISSLGGGGAERVMSIMASHWAEFGWTITLLTYDDGREDSTYDLHASVIRRHLGIERESRGVWAAVTNNLGRLRVLRRAIRESVPDAVISFLDEVNVRTILATLGLGIPVIVSERNNPFRKPLGPAWSVLRRWSYRYASGVVAQTSDYMRYFSEAIQRRGHVIPNPVPVPPDMEHARLNSRRMVVLAVGRLVRQKGFDRLLAAFSMIAAEHAEWSLTIWGEGEDRRSLEMLRDRLGLRHRVSFPGWTAEPFEEMRRAGLFVMSSRYEGFPMALCEAMACGVPVISFNCPGPRDIVRDGIDGILVSADDVEALAAAMDRLMAHQSERERLGANGVQIATRFQKEHVMEKWETLVYHVIDSSKSMKRSVLRFRNRS